MQSMCFTMWHFGEWKGTRHPEGFRPLYHTHTTCYIKVHPMNVVVSTWRVRGFIEIWHHGRISYKSSLLWPYHITVLQNGLPLSDYVWQPLGRQAMPSETWAPVGRLLCRICPPCRFCKGCVHIQHQNEALIKIGKIHPWCYLCSDNFCSDNFLFLLYLPTLELFTEHRSQVW
jgi:hypothetical protein